MPQITLEYTSNVSQSIDFNKLFSDLHQILSDVGGIRIKNCKSRAVRRDDYLIGDGTPNGAFVHVELMLVKGRSSEWVTKIGNLLLEKLEAAYNESKVLLDLQITVHFSDLDRDRYFKYPSGTLTPLEEIN